MSRMFYSKQEEKNMRCANENCSTSTYPLEEPRCVSVTRPIVKRGPLHRKLVCAYEGWRAVGAVALSEPVPHQIPTYGPKGGVANVLYRTNMTGRRRLVQNSFRNFIGCVFLILTLSSTLIVFFWDTMPVAKTEDRRGVIDLRFLVAEERDRT